MVAALVVAACGASDSQGKAPSASVRTTSPTSTAPPEVSTLAPDGGGRLLGELIATIPDPGIHPLMASAFAAVNDAADSCDRLAPWTEHMAVAASRFEHLLPRVQSSPALVEWRGTPEARALSDAIRDRFVLQERCQNGATVATDDELRQATLVTGRAVAINDWYRIRLHQLQPSVGADMWYHADQLGHLLGVEQLAAANDGVDTIVVGTNRVKRGVDGRLLSEATGTTVMNGGMPLLYPTVMTPWIEQLLRRGRKQSSRVVIGVGSSDAYRNCTTARIEKMDRATELQHQAFATLPVLADVDHERLLVGSDTPSYPDSPVLRSHQATTIADSHGTGVTGTEPDAERTAVDRARYQELLLDPVRCDAIVTSLGGLVSGLTAFGVDVVVVGMPIHPEVQALAAANDVSLDQVSAEQAALAADNGGRFVDLTSLLAEDEFVDLTDPTEQGRERVTAALALALNS